MGEENDLLKTKNEKLKEQMKKKRRIPWSGKIENAEWERKSEWNVYIVKEILVIFLEESITGKIFERIEITNSGAIKVRALRKFVFIWPRTVIITNY